MGVRQRWDDANYRGSAYPTYGWGAEVVDVEIDPVSYQIAVKSVITCQDVGRAVNPSIVEGQIEGGTVQALGWAALRGVSCSPTAPCQQPPLEVHHPDGARRFRHHRLDPESPYVNGPFGAKGVGEMPMDGAAPAFAAAVDQATGGFFRQIPILPEVVAAHLAPARCAGNAQHEGRSRGQRRAPRVEAPRTATPPRRDPRRHRAHRNRGRLRRGRVRRLHRHHRTARPFARVSYPRRRRTAPSCSRSRAWREPATATSSIASPTPVRRSAASVPTRDGGDGGVGVVGIFPRALAPFPEVADLLGP